MRKSLIWGVHMTPRTMPQAASEPAAIMAMAYPAASPPPPPMPSILRTKKNSPMISAALKTALKIIFAADHARIAAKAPLPEAVADDDYGVAFGLVFLGRKGTAEAGLRAQQAEQAGRYARRDRKSGLRGVRGPRG